MKFSKTILAIAALFAVSTFSTVKPASYLERAKKAAADAAAKAKDAYNKAEKAYNDLGGTEAIKGYYTTGQEYLGKAQGMYNDYMGTTSETTSTEE